MIGYNDSQLAILESTAKNVSWLFDITSTSVSVSAITTEDGEPLLTEDSGQLVTEEGGTGESSASASYYHSTKQLNSLVKSGITARADTRLSLVNGTAFAWLNGIDLSPYAGMYLIVRDSAGKRISGWMKAAGSSETAGSELLSNTTFDSVTTGWTAAPPAGPAALSSVAGGYSNNCLQVAENGADNPYAYQAFSGLAVGSLIKFFVHIKQGSQADYRAYVWLDANSQVPDATSHVGSATWNLVTTYGTLMLTGATIVLMVPVASGSGDTFLFDEVSLKRIIAPPETGVTIVSAQGGSTYNWEEIETGFNYNDAAGYSYEIHLNSAMTDYTYAIVDFSGIALRASHPELGLQLPSETSFSLVDPDDAVPEDDLVGGTAIITLRIGVSGTSMVAGRWKFRITRADRAYGRIQIEAQNYFWHYFSGSYPNTKLVGELWNVKNNALEDGICVPQPFGTAYIPLKSATDGSTRFYLLGPTTIDGSAVTYTISAVRTPRSIGSKIEWTSASYTFLQDTFTDLDFLDWQGFYPIISDSDGDGVLDETGLWKEGDSYLPMPTKFSRSDTASLTSPADVIEYVLEDMGIDSDDLDADSFTAAKAVYGAWGLEFNGAYWYKQPRVDVVSQLLVMCNSSLLMEDKIRLLPRSSVNQATLYKRHIGGESGSGGTFSYRTSLNADIVDDCGYVAWQEEDESQDAYIKTLVPADNHYNHISSDVVEVPFVQDSENVKRIGSLYHFRRLNKKADISFSGSMSLIGLRPDDVITIEHSDYGGSYKVIVDSLRVAHDCSLQFGCTRYSGSIRGWGEVVAVAATITEDPDLDGIWRPVMMGPDASGTTPPNLIIGRLRVGLSAVIDGDAGGFYVKTTTFTSDGIQLEYNAGSPRFYVGDGANEYLKYTSAGLAISTAVNGGITIKSGGSITLESGGDLILQSATGGNAANIEFVGAARTYYFGVDYDKNRLILKSDTVNAGTFYIGMDTAGNFTPLSEIEAYCEHHIFMQAMDSGGSRLGSLYLSDSLSYLQSSYNANNTAIIQIVGGAGTSLAQLTFEIVHAGTVRMFDFYYSTTDSAYYVGPRTNKYLNLAASDVAWDNAYADDWNNVADFAYMDDIDDLAIIRAIGKHPEAIHDATGLPVIDDSTLNPILINRRDGKEERTADGKPWVASATMFGLLLGAIKQLDARVAKLEGI